MNAVRKLTVMLTAVSFISIAFQSFAEAPRKVYYRYLNDEGVKVIRHSIPPKYVQKGYEVVTLSGEVLRVVAPAVSSEEAARLKQERMEAEKLAEWDNELKRRYSSQNDIEAAKQRKLKELEGNIAILEGNIRTLRTQIAQQHASAAEKERQGQSIPQVIVDALAALEEELSLTEELLQEREKQSEEITEKYDRDKARFAIIRPEDKNKP